MAEKSLFLPEIQELFLSHLDSVERKEAALVCKGFYATICHLEREKSFFLNDEMVLDDKIFESIMQSRRRFSEVSIIFGYPDKDVDERLVTVLEKFKKHLKSLIIFSFSTCSEETFSQFLEIACEMEKFVLIGDPERPIVLQKQFKKLRNLEIVGIHEMTAILDKVPDDSLEELRVQTPGRAHLAPVLEKESLQSFLDRQKKLKILKLPSSFKPKIDHLVLEQLEIHIDDGKELAEILKKQPALQRFNCYDVDEIAFEEICKLPNLEYLEANFYEDVAGELTSLKKLVVSDSEGGISGLVLPNLEELVTEENKDNDWLTLETWQALSRNAPNLQHITWSCPSIKQFKEVVENFPALKTMLVRLYKGYYEDDDILLPPTRENLSLEELIIHDSGPTDPICDIINACPNLKRIHLRYVLLSKHQILDLFQRHPSLTHFHFQGWFSDVDGILGPVFKQIVEIFKNSPSFVSLRLHSLHHCACQNVEDFLAGETDRITVIKQSDSYDDLSLIKKSRSGDPFKNFHKKYLITLPDLEF